MGFLDKAKDLLAKNSDKVDSAIDKAGDLVDKRTQGKYASHVNKVQDAAKKAVADNAAQGQVPPDQAALHHGIVYKGKSAHHQLPQGCGM